VACWPAAANPLQGEKLMGARLFRRLMSRMFGIDPRFTVRRLAVRRFVG
jgi:hypothetical protein